jgi:hypothetical protein
MSGLGGGNGDGWPPDGGGQPDGLPGLPPEWGTIVIPDDPAELATEATKVRRELRRQARRATWRRRFGLPQKAAGDDSQQPSLGLPLLIMSIAVIATLTSLFAVAWPGRNNHPILAPNTPRQTVAGATSGRKVPDLALTDATGTAVRLRDLVPAALVLVDGCRCAELVFATVAAAPQAVQVVTIGRTAPTLSPPVASPAKAVAPSGPASAASATASIIAHLRALADPRDELRSALGLAPPGTQAMVVLVSQTGDVIRTLSNVDSIDQYKADLAQLTKG